MPKRQSKTMSESSSKNPKTKMMKTERLAWLVAVVVLLLLLLAFMAAYYKWWPAKHVTTTPTTGSTSATSTQPTAGGGGTGSTTTTGSNGSSGSNGATGASGATGAAGANGSTTTSDIFMLYGQIISGQTIDQVAALAGSLKPSCTTISSTNAKICVYTQGDKVVTVTYLDNQVVSVSKSGF